MTETRFVGEIGIGTRGGHVAIDLSALFMNWIDNIAEAVVNDMDTREELGNLFRDVADSKRDLESIGTAPDLQVYEQEVVARLMESVEKIAAILMPNGGGVMLAPQAALNLAGALAQSAQQIVVRN